MTRTDQLHESVGRAFRAASWAGLLGTGLVVLALTFDLIGNRPMAQQVDTLQREAEALHRRLRAPSAPVISNRERLTRFYMSFPASSELPDLLARLHGYALARGINATKADYRSSVESGAPLERLVLDLPIRASYPALRDWLADVLDEMPEVAVESVAFKRQVISSPELEVQVRFILYLRVTP